MARTVRGARSFEEIRAQDPHLNQAICHMMELRVEAVTAAARDLIADTEIDFTMQRPPKDRR
jgi:hypothetical protein